MTITPATIPSFSWDVEDYGKMIDTGNPKSLKEPVINGFISWSMEEYKRRKFRDNSLWEAIGDDFEGWTREMFEKANKHCLRELRDLLRENGVFLQKGRLISIAGELEKVVSEPKPQEWTLEQIREQMQEKFNSRYSRLAYLSSFLPDQSVSVHNFDGPGEKKEFPQLIYLQTSASGIFGREIDELVKIYKSDFKYSGRKDNFEHKLGIFYDLCRKTGVPPDYFGDTFSTMLKGKARQYYYHNIIGRSYNFETMVRMVKNHFEMTRRESILIKLSKWKTTFLKLRENLFEK
ncbi:hypothetical protein K3495_g5191 [Podosphaera aphanis]|nr:hypothetical protein K3495_g5191 [Podosphaera aphanis]